MSQSSRAQVQALFLILLLSGGDCLRIQQENGWRIAGHDVCRAKDMINEDQMMKRYESKTQSLKSLAENIKDTCKDTCTKGCMKKSMVLVLRLKKMKSCLQILPDINKIPEGVQEVLLNGPDNLASVFHEAQSAMTSVMDSTKLFPIFTDTPELAACKFEPMNLDLQKVSTNDEEEVNLMISKQLFGINCTQSAKQEYMAKLPAASLKLMNNVMDRLLPVIKEFTAMRDAQKTDDDDEVAGAITSFNEVTEELLKASDDMEKDLDPDVIESLVDSDETVAALLQLDEEAGEAALTTPDVNPAVFLIQILLGAIVAFLVFWFFMVFAFSR